MTTVESVLVIMAAVVILAAVAEVAHGRAHKSAVKAENERLWSLLDRMRAVTIEPAAEKKVERPHVEGATPQAAEAPEETAGPRRSPLRTSYLPDEDEE